MKGRALGLLEVSTFCTQGTALTVKDPQMWIIGDV